MYKFNQKAFLREFYSLALFVWIIWGKGVIEWKMALGILVAGTVLSAMANSPQKNDREDYRTTVTALSLTGFGVIAAIATAIFGLSGMALALLITISLVCMLSCLGYAFPKASLLAYAVQLPVLFSVIAYSDWEFSNNPFLGA